MATHELTTLMEGMITRLKADADVIATFKDSTGVAKIFPWKHEREFEASLLPLVSVIGTSPGRDVEYSKSRKKNLAVQFEVVGAYQAYDRRFQIYDDLKLIQDVIEADANQEPSIGGYRFTLDDVQVLDPSEDADSRFMTLKLIAIYTVAINK